MVPTWWVWRVLVLLSCLAFGSAGAQTAPSGEVLLTVSGQVSKPNAGKRALFDRAMLEKLPQHSFTTRLPWLSEPARFTGPLLRDVLAAAGASGTRIVAIALNDYRTEIPFADVTRHDVIAARLMNGKPMTVRDKGPLSIVYPFDSNPELRTELFYGRAAWQLIELQVQ
jgi:hypothetical protein